VFFNGLGGIVLTFSEAAILGLVQGLTEFLPVSSSGHLVLGREFFDIDTQGAVSFDVVVHLGTLFSVFVVLWQDIKPLVCALPSLFGPGSWSRRWESEGGFRLLVLVGLGTLPLVFLVVPFHDAVEATFTVPKLVAAMLLVTAGALLLPVLVRSQRDGPLTVSRVVVVALVQALAVVPGISRSGATISAALALGVKRESAGTFSFLLAIPAILGAVVFKIPDITSSGMDFGVLAAGFLAAFVSGIVALKWLLALVRGGRLWVFCPYLVILATLFLVLG